jgi:hypothetical protein
VQYTKGTVGRVFVLKFEDDDVILKEIDKLARRERISSAAMVFIGALKKGDLAAGPKKPVIPPEPNWVKFKDAWEIMGLGTIFTNKSGPQIHLHTAMGKKRKTLIGCVRKDTKVFLVIEAILFELKGVKATKMPDPKTGLNLLKIL